MPGPVVSLCVALLLVLAVTGLYWCRCHFGEEMSQMSSKSARKLVSTFRQVREEFDNSAEDPEPKCAKNDIKCKWKAAERKRKQKIAELTKEQDENEKAEEAEEAEEEGEAEEEEDEKESKSDGRVDEQEDEERRVREKEEKGTVAGERQEKEGLTRTCMTQRIRVRQGGTGSFSTTKGDLGRLLVFLGTDKKAPFHVASATSRTRTGNTRERQNAYAYLNGERPTMRLTSVGSAANVTEPGEHEDDAEATVQVSPGTIHVPSGSLLNLCMGESPTPEEKEDDEDDGEDDEGEGDEDDEQQGGKGHPAYDPATLDRDDFDMGNDMKSIHRWDKSRADLTGVREFGYPQDGRRGPLENDGGVDFDGAYGVVSRKPRSADLADEREGVDACLLQGVKTFEGGENFVTMRLGDFKKIRDLLLRHDTEFLVFANAESRGNNTILTQERKLVLDLLNTKRIYFKPVLRNEEDGDEDEEKEDDDDEDDDDAVVRVDLVRERERGGSGKAQKKVEFPHSLLLDVCCTDGHGRPEASSSSFEAATRDAK